MTSRNRKIIFTILKYALGIGMGVVLFFLAIRGVDFKEVKQGFLNANYFWVLLAVLVAILSHWLRAVRWKNLLHAAGYESNSLNLFASLMVGNLVNNAIPRGGEITRPTMTSRSENIPFSITLGTIVTDRIFDFIILGGLIVFVFLTQAKQIGIIMDQAFAQNTEPGQAAQGGISLTLILIIALAVIIAGLLIFRKKIIESGIWEKSRSFLKEMLMAIRSIRKMENPLLFVIHTLGIWVCYVLMTYLAFFALEETAKLSFMFALTAFTLGGIGMVIPTPGGIGSYHYAIAITFWAYAPVLGMTPENAKGLGLSIAFIIHTSQMLMMIVVGFICYFYLVRKLRKPDERKNIQQAS